MRTISRRKLMVAPAAYAFLKPFVDCLEARADAPSAPACFVVLHKTQGQYVGREKSGTPNWIPTMSGTEMKLPRLLQSFEPVKNYLTFLVGFDDYANPKSGGNWHNASANVLTGATFPVAGKEDMGGPPRHESIHWYVADRMKTEPLLISPFWTRGQESWKPMLSAWRRAGSGIQATIPYGQPSEAYKNVFGALRPDVVGTASDPKEQARALRQRSLLDYLLADAKRIQAAAAPDHRLQMESHLEGLRKLEKDIFGAPGSPPVMAGSCEPPALGSKAFIEDYLKREHTETLLQKNEMLQKVALISMRCGLRRVVGYELNGAAGCEDMRPGIWNKDFYHPADRASGGGLGYHFSHFHQAQGPVNTSDHEWVVATEEFLMKTFFAPLLVGMKDIPSGTTNLLEKSLAFYSTCQTFNHSTINHSFIVAGNAGGKVKSNRILTNFDVTANPNKASGRALNDVLISVLHGWGYTDVKTFGDAEFCRGPVAGFV